MAIGVKMQVSFDADADADADAGADVDGHLPAIGGVMAFAKLGPRPQKQLCSTGAPALTQIPSLRRVHKHPTHRILSRNY